MSIGNKVIHMTLLGLCSLNLLSVSSVATADEAAMLINFGVSGSWYEPATAGQGFVIEILPLNNLLAAYWFTYPVQGGAREWYVATGEISGDTAELTIYQTENGVFDEASMVETNAVGSASLVFSSCEASTWTYQIDNLDLSGEIPLQRIAPDQMCEQFLATANTDIVSHTNAWVDIRGEWLFEGCVNLENSDSHGDEVFTFTDTTATLIINRYSNPDCLGVHSLQVLNFEVQRLDKTLAFLAGEEVIANRIIWVDEDSDRQIKQLFYVDDRGDSQLLTHGVLDGPADSEGFPTDLHSLFAERIISTR
jgi:hypothetical protein